MSVLGEKLIENDAPRPMRMGAGVVGISVYAYVPGKDIESPATKAEADAIWNGRTVSLQSSPNSVNWTDVDTMTNVATDTTYQGLMGNLHYRVVPDAGYDLVNLRAVAIMSNSNASTYPYE